MDNLSDNLSDDRFSFTVLVIYCVANAFLRFLCTCMSPFDRIQTFTNKYKLIYVPPMVKHMVSGCSIDHGASRKMFRSE